MVWDWSLTLWPNALSLGNHCYFWTLEFTFTVRLERGMFHLLSQQTVSACNIIYTDTNIWFKALTVLIQKTMAGWKYIWKLYTSSNI